MKISLIGDLHFAKLKNSTKQSEEAKFDFYNSFMNHFFNNSSDFFVSLGDLTNFGYQEEIDGIFNIIRSYDKEFYQVLGNHDLYASTKSEYLQAARQDEYFSFEEKGTVFCFLNSAKEQDFEDWGGEISQEQLVWFEKVILQSEGKNLIVFAHHPIYNTTARSNLDKLSITPTIDIWSILSKRTTPAVYINGHNHENSIVTNGNWTFIQIASCIDDSSWRNIEVADNQLILSYHKMEHPVLKESIPLFVHNMDHFKLYETPFGRESDRATIINL